MTARRGAIWGGALGSCVLALVLTRRVGLLQPLEEVLLPVVLMAGALLFPAVRKRSIVMMAPAISGPAWVVGCAMFVALWVAAGGILGWLAALIKRGR